MHFKVLNCNFFHYFVVRILNTTTAFWGKYYNYPKTDWVTPATSLVTRLTRAFTLEFVHL